jgi:hypothetical protein
MPAGVPEKGGDNHHTERRTEHTIQQMEANTAGSQRGSGTTPSATAVKVKACTAVNAITTANRLRNRLNGATKQRRNTKRSTANASTKPALTKANVAS